MKGLVRAMFRGVGFRVAALYFLFGVIWILMSDRVLSFFVRDATALTVAQSYKGIAYVLITTALLFVAINRFLSRASRAETALSRGEHQLMTILDQAGAIVFVKDREGRHLVANLRLREILRLPIEAIIHRTSREIMPGSAAEMESNDRSVIEAGAAMTFQEWVDAPGGRRWYHVTKIPIFDDDGLVQSLVGIAVDITEQRNAEEELRRTRAFLDRLVSVLPSFLYIYDVNSDTFVFASDGLAGVTGYTYDELAALGRDALGTLVHPDDLEGRREDFRRFRDAGDSITSLQECRIRRKNGEEIWVADHIGVYERDDDGRVRLVAGSVMDIGERVRQAEEKAKLEQQLAQSQKMEAIGLLAGGVAHDFNNLLTAILGYTDFIIAGLSDRDPLADDAREIRAAAERAASLTQQLLAFSRRQIISPRVVSVNAMLAESRRMLARVIGEDVELIHDLDPAGGHVRIDPHQFDQLLMNLAVNARDAMPGGGKLIFETSTAVLDDEFCQARENIQPGNYVVVSVSDTGRGMDRETRERIFEPFFTTKERGKGTGLGLSTVYGIVRQNAGAITVYSEPGIGTTFRIYLPATDAGAEATAELTPVIDAPGQGTILLVEDEDLVRRFTVRSLAAAGYEVIEAAQADEALSAFRDAAGSVDLLVTDVVMPRVSGAELCRRLRAEKPDLPVLFISGYTADAIVHHGVLDADVNFLQKPFTARQIARRVREILDVRSASPTD
ncbi:MAG: PAS domain S-box protein [Deltaproteobacteria bacterium]|nr:PAS domain S-box protein [Deltaproteobacteria bacterium]